MTGAAAAVMSAGPLVLAVSIPAFANAHGDFTPISTSSVAASVVGGTGPYTYSWTQVFGSSVGTWTIDSPTAASTTFTCNSAGFGVNYGESEFICTVTDGLGATAVSNALSSHITETGGP